MRGMAELGRDCDEGGRAPELVYERLLAADAGRLPKRSDRRCSSELGLCTCGMARVHRHSGTAPHVWDVARCARATAACGHTLVTSTSPCES